MKIIARLYVDKRFNVCSLDSYSYYKFVDYISTDSIDIDSDRMISISEMYSLAEIRISDAAIIKNYLDIL